MTTEDQQRQAAEQDPAEAAPPRAPRGGAAIGGALRAVGPAGRLVLAALTLATTALTLLFLLWPGLRPTPPPGAFHALLSEPRLEQGVALGAFAERRGLSLTDEYDAAARRRVGVVVSLNVELQGYKGRPCALRWTMFDAATQRARAEPWLRDQPAWPDGILTPTGDLDQANAEAWLPVPPRPAEVFVRFKLHDPNGVALAAADTAPFAAPGEAADAPGGAP